MPNTCLYRASVYDDRWPIVANRCDEAAWHIFVASWYRDVSVVVLCLGISHYFTYIYFIQGGLLTMTT